MVLMKSLKRSISSEGDEGIGGLVGSMGWAFVKDEG